MEEALTTITLKY